MFAADSCFVSLLLLLRLLLLRLLLLLLLFNFQASFSDVAHARRIYEACVGRLLRLGTTTANYFTTILPGDVPDNAHYIQLLNKFTIKCTIIHPGDLLGIMFNTHHAQYNTLQCTTLYTQVICLI
jgi:hypothetical protein